MLKEVLLLLRSMGIRVSERYMDARLQSHPEYPSIISIIDTLEELGIESEAFQADKNALRSETKFLLHFKTGGGQFRFFRTLGQAEAEVENFDEEWSGVVLKVKNPVKLGDFKHDTQLREDDKWFRTKIMLGILLLVGVGFSYAFSQSLSGSVLCVFMLLGLTLSWLTVEKELGFESALAEAICSFGKKGGCETVLRSQTAKPFSWLTWSDVGVTYFTSAFLYLTIFPMFSLQEVALQVFKIISISGVVFAAYSLYSQKFVLKEFCLLCLGVVAVLLASSIISAITLGSLTLNLAFCWYTGVFGFLLTTVVCIWILIKTLLTRANALDILHKRYLLMKRNSLLFNSLLNDSPLKESNKPGEIDAISWGNNLAPTQIVMACSPFCTPCAQAHHIFDELLKKHKDRIHLSVRFALHTIDTTDAKVAAAREIIKASKTNKSALGDWFKEFQIPQFVLSSDHSTEGEINQILENQVLWTQTEEVFTTPTFFINGRRLPASYNWREYIEILELELKN